MLLFLPDFRAKGIPCQEIINRRTRWISILSAYSRQPAARYRFTPEIRPAKKVFAICAAMYYILLTPVSGSAEESEGFGIIWRYYC